VLRWERSPRLLTDICKQYSKNLEPYSSSGF
jgi:hypothetical protein